MATIEQINYLEKRLEQIDRRFEELETIKGHFIAFDSKATQTKEELAKLNQELKEWDIEVEKIKDLFKDPEKGIYARVKAHETSFDSKTKELESRLSILDTKTKALELKFDTRIDNLSPDVYQIKDAVKTLKLIGGERFEKLEASISQKERQNVWFERVLSATLAAGFSLLVAVLKECNPH